MNEPELLQCAKHRDQTTQLRCGRCGDPICIRCLSHAPGGMRCPSCAGREAGAPRKRATVRNMIRSFVGLAFILGFAAIYLPSVREQAVGLFDRTRAADELPVEIPGTQERPSLSLTPSPRQIRTPAPVPTAQQVFRIGQRINITDWGYVTLLSFELDVDPNDPFVPRSRDGWRYGLGDFEACLTRPGGSALVSEFDFFIQMENNTRVPPGARIRRPNLGSATLFEGDCVRGYISFEIPGDVAIDSLNQHLSDFSRNQTFRLRWVIE